MAKNEVFEFTVEIRENSVTQILREIDLVKFTHSVENQGFF